LKKAQSLLFLLLIVSIAFSLTACHKKKVTPLEPTPETSVPSTTEPTEPQPSVEKPTTEGPVVLDIDEVSKQLQPVFFDFNKYDIREDQIPALQNDARVLKQNQTVTVLVEGHCDERGTDEYNLALGERRADAAKDFLVSLGIEEARLSTISYGESKPFAQGHNEDAWRQNRRAQFVAVRK
jgi:peptidoglycan-associated lipoprotein